MGSIQSSVFYNRYSDTNRDVNSYCFTSSDVFFFVFENVKTLSMNTHTCAGTVNLERERERERERYEKLCNPSFLMVK